MKRKDIERSIYEEFNDNKPDLYQQILSQCPKLTEPPRKSTLLTRLGDVLSRRSFRYSFASLSVIALIIFVMFGTSPSVEPQAYSIVAIEANPSLVLELDQDDVVIQVTATNDDALIILGEMDLIGVNSDVAINAIIGSMVIKGYISDIANSVLLSIQSNDASKELELVDELTRIVSNLLSGSSINGSVITQTLHLDEDAEELAELLGISEAKAELILDIVDIDPRSSAEHLAKLSINDLNLLLEAKNYAMENVKHVGSASNLGIISVTEVYQIALNNLGLDASDVLEYDIELEQEDGVLLYEIEIETDSTEYKLLINAKLGTVYDPSDNGDLEDPIDDELLEETLTESAILSLLVNQLNLDIVLVSKIEMEMESENGILFYDISFDYGDDEYELEVDAISGEIYYNSMDDEGYDYDDSESDD